jgi:hypothetical protein
MSGNSRYVVAAAASYLRRAVVIASARLSASSEAASSISAKSAKCLVSAGAGRVASASTPASLNAKTSFGVGAGVLAKQLSGLATESTDVQRIASGRKHGTRSSTRSNASESTTTSMAVAPVSSASRWSKKSFTQMPGW